MNYYSISQVRSIINLELLKNDENDYKKHTGLNPHQIGRDEDVHLLFSEDDIFISEKDFIFKLMDFNKKLKENNAKTDINQIDISSALLTANTNSDVKDLMHYEGLCNQLELEILHNLAKKELRGNPNYEYFKNLKEIANSPESVVAMDFEFKHMDIREIGITYQKDNKIHSERYLVKENITKYKESIESLSNVETKEISVNEIQGLLRKIFNKYDNFLFHDCQAEKKLIRRIFKGFKNTPFNNKHKKVLDTYRSALYMKDKDPFYFEGYDQTLKGVCLSTRIDFNQYQLHNSANDTFYTFMAARKMAQDFKYKWSFYHERDNGIENILPKTNDLNDVYLKKGKKLKNI
jgi:hypothetical protein